MSHTTKIISNGSRWLGEPPATVAGLLEVLAEHPLDPSFEEYGNFIIPAGSYAGYRLTKFWGNFAELSHVFNIETDDPVLIAQLTAAIRANQRREDYKELRGQHWLEMETRRQERGRARAAKLIDGAAKAIEEYSEDELETELTRRRR